MRLGDDPAVASRRAGAPRLPAVRRCGTPAASPSSRSLWVLRTVLLPHGSVGWVFFGVLVVAELAAALLGRALRTMTPWHRHHIAERYELFTIIVLGEVDPGDHAGDLRGRGCARTARPAADARSSAALLMVFSLWWIYFKRPMVDSLTRRDRLRLRLRPLLRVRLGRCGRRLSRYPRRRPPGRCARRHPHCGPAARRVRNRSTCWWSQALHSLADRSLAHGRAGSRRGRPDVGRCPARARRRDERAARSAWWSASASPTTYDGPTAPPP